MAKHYILMGDIISSSLYAPKSLRNSFIHLISDCNDMFAHDIISPYTITLGDEFQGIAVNSPGMSRPPSIVISPGVCLERA